MTFTIEPLTDTATLEQWLTERWGEGGVVSRGRVHTASGLLALAAYDTGEALVGLVSFCIEGDSCEVVTLDTSVSGKGIGTALLSAAEAAARAAGCQRLWLITTNDNLPALRFYQRHGWRLCALHANALAESRRLKLAIPEIGLDGIPLRDELELERMLT